MKSFMAGFYVISSKNYYKISYLVNQSQTKIKVMTFKIKVKCPFKSLTMS